MKCSHGLAYEVKCPECYAEAMSREGLVVKSSGVKSSLLQGTTMLFDAGVRVGVRDSFEDIRSKVDSIRDVS